MIDSGIHMSFWAEALQTAVYLHQRTPTTSIFKYRSPYEVLHQKQPKIGHHRCFGCVAYKYIAKEQRDKGKFTERSKPSMMLGYVHDTAKIWRIWDFEIKKAIECSNVIFTADLNAFEAIQQERIDPDQIVFPQTVELEIIEIPEMSVYELQDEALNEGNIPPITDEASDRGNVPTPTERKLSNFSKMLLRLVNHQ
jgi:hypothetical protein